jgi:hypothetical protein
VRGISGDIVVTRRRCIVRVFGTGVGCSVVVVGIIVGVIVVSVVGVKFVKIIAVTVSESEATVGVGATSKIMDPVPDLCRHRQFGPVGAV